MTSENTFGLKTSKSSKANNRYKPWFDKTCTKARNRYHNARRRYNINKNEYNKKQLKCISKEYKTTINESIKCFKATQINKLTCLKSSNPKEYWKIINSIDKKEQPLAPLNDLYSYFKDINSKTFYDENTNQTEINSAPDDMANLNEEINQPISAAEILTAVKNLKNNKSAGIDNVINEHLKVTIDHMLPIYIKLFNLILDSGLIPSNWTLGSILPIYKNKGSKNEPQNYRPITLLSCFGKLFTAIINKRLNIYAEKYEIINQCQSGFRKGFSTIENLFILNSLIDIVKAKKTQIILRIY